MAGGQKNDCDAREKKRERNQARSDCFNGNIEKKRGKNVVDSVCRAETRLAGYVSAFPVSSDVFRRVFLDQSNRRRQSKPEQMSVRRFALLIMQKLPHPTDITIHIIISVRFVLTNHFHQTAGAAAPVREAIQNRVPKKTHTHAEYSSGRVERSRPAFPPRSPTRVQKTASSRRLLLAVRIATLWPSFRWFRPEKINIISGRPLYTPNSLGE